MGNASTEWSRMLGRSFAPWEWFLDDGMPGDTHCEDKIMWVYREVGNGADVRFQVGYYDPTGSWHADTAYTDREVAAKRVNFLNGGVKTETC